ncbi:hypothetical protein F5Y17DRAFT_462648 [Xylariaceae sp. FL0594]|nr:hypothetical protein F5Y17DRAFT_462648 [Xylariaceae sp. FL0594]
MAYQQTIHAGSMPYALYTDIATDGVMDPEIKRPVSPWAVERYLTDNQNSPLVVYPAADCHASGVLPLFAPTQLHRDGSPSYTNSSSTCSSALSPPRDTDYCQARSSPASSEAQFMPPYEGWPHLGEFTGLADGCVSLGDVHPVQGVSAGYYEESPLLFAMPTRTGSMSSDCSNISSIEVWSDELFPNEPVHHKPLQLEPPPTPTDLTPKTPAVETEMCGPDPVDLRLPEVANAECASKHDSPYMEAEPTEIARADVEHGLLRELEVVVLPKSGRSAKSPKRKNTSKSSPEAKRAKVMAELSRARPGATASANSNNGQFTCKACPKVSFQDKASLDNHVKKQHTRPFTCIFNFAGCHSTFASKNEWKRHCTSQHIGLQYWVCQQDSCAQHTSRPNASRRSPGAVRRRSGLPCSLVEEPSSLPNGSIFNRKDLYTQHIRRMHVPAHLKKHVKGKKNVPEWEVRQRQHQLEAIRNRCQLPTHMTCPAENCTTRFDGANAWDERMEHVAKHLEKSAAGREPQVLFGGESDAALVNWAASPAIGILRRGDEGRWILQNPLRCSEPPAAPVFEDDDEDVDAEGEEVDY